MSSTATPPSLPTPQPLPGPNASPAPDEARLAHRARIGHLAEALGLRLGLDPDAAQLLRLAAPLHDIGEFDPTAAEFEPDWPLTSAEGRRRAQAQPRRGAALLGGSRLPLFVLAAEIALNYRERWDGNGYPDGLKGKTIPLSARIVAVVDYFDSLTMQRRFRPARADDRALAMLAEQAGSAFDPDIVAAFLAHAPALIALRDRVDAMQSAGGTA
ncbi:HD domain-containing phosphohydrolase [Roseateles asaccharophilus]|uniref:Two-component system response regulator n=1 Tax=Roseateles asaccharophilus TaxID=582607 RepID=A0ABU2A8K6_9BURK|nr:HD domain-containing phosphohydrolase [Roseateles asaccharophilus]MDR7332832.1 putative two-component system response regulator [Roseateles asaccharophilus]